MSSVDCSVVEGMAIEDVDRVLTSIRDAFLLAIAREVETSKVDSDDAVLSEDKLAEETVSVVDADSVVKSVGVDRQVGDVGKKEEGDVVTTGGVDGGKVLIVDTQFDTLSRVSGESWSDMVESEEGSSASVMGGAPVPANNAGVSMPEDKTVSLAVQRVCFGGVSDLDDARPLKSPEKGFFSSYVRVPRVRILAGKLAKSCGSQLPRQAMEEVALVTYTTATVPLAFANGAVRIRGLAAVGDAAMAYVLTSVMYGRSEPVNSVQMVKSVKLSNSTMSRVFVEKGWHEMISLPGGVDPGTSKIGADCFEAMAGVVARWCDIRAVRSFMVAGGLV